MADEKLTADIEQFKAMMWEARRLRMEGKEKGSAGYRLAASYARKHDLTAEAEIAEAMVLSVSGKAEEAVARIAAATSGTRVPGLGHFFHAAARFAAKQYGTAIEALNKALVSADFDRPGDAWFVMGLAYAGQKQYEKAVDCYRKVFDTLGSDVPGYVWHCMGLAYAGQKQYEKAIECYREALDIPSNDAPGDTWFNMGLAYAGQKKDDKAVECWLKAVPLYRQSGKHNWAAIAEGKIRAAEKDPKQRSSNDRAALEETAAVPGADDDGSPERRIIAKIDSVQDTKYEAYGRQYDAAKRDEVKEVLAILRGWGSAVGLVPAKGGSPCRGGGYLLKWGGKGLLIDPGFDCLANLHEAGFHCREVNAVVVSHNHTDHNDDLRSFDDIRYEMYWRAKKAKDEKSRRAWEYLLLWDKDTESHQKLDLEEAEHRHQRTMEQLSPHFGRMEQELKGLPFRVHWFKVKHGKDVPHAVGIRVDCLNEDRSTAVTIGFTCDTEYFDGLCNKDALGGCDILVAHMSMPDREEYSDPTHVKPNHLGYRGVEKLIRGAEPKLTVVGEFWAGIADIRIDLVAGLRELCKTETIIPASIGLQLKPSSKEIRCTNCGRWTSLAETKISSPAQEFGPLSYLCPNCRL